MAGAEANVAQSKKSVGRLKKYVAAEISSQENPTLRDFTNKLNDLLLQREDKLRFYSPKSEQVKSLDRSIAEVKSWISKETRFDRSGEVKKINPTVLRGEEWVVTNQMHAAEARAVSGTLETQIAALLDQRQAILQAMDELDGLNRRYDAAQHNYQLYATNFEKARIDEDLDRKRISNVRVIETASYNPVRVKPRTGLLVSLAPVLAAGFSGLVVYLSLLTDRRFHDGEALESAAAVPVLVTVPEKSSDGSRDALETDRVFEAALNQLVDTLERHLSGSENRRILLIGLGPGAGASFLTEALKQRLAVRLGSGSAVPPLVDGGELIMEASEVLKALGPGDDVVLVLAAGQSTLPELESGLRRLRIAAGVEPIGIVLNRRPLLIPLWLYRLFQ